MILSTERVKTDDNPENDKICITVFDNGTGIAAHIRENIFNPFFTTKPSGEGTGLGLSISHDIIAVHGGTMTVDSTENEFTEFKILLPLLSKEEITPLISGRTGQAKVS